VVEITLTPGGQALFSSLTTAAFQACGAAGPGNCPQNHVTMWADLTPDDTAHWEERAVTLYKPVDEGGKLLSDPYVQEPVLSSRAIVGFGLTQARAEAMARRLNMDRAH
jgi:hypothetical protein